MLLNKNNSLKINNPTDYRIYYALIAVLLLSLIACALNQLIYQYPGNYYLPSNSPCIMLTVFLIYAGFYLQWGRHGKPTKISKEIIYFFFIMGVIGIATNAVQYTPFPTIDKQIFQLETQLNINMQAIMAWTHSKPQLKANLEFIYNTLPYQMAYIPFLVMLTGRFQILREFYFLLLINTLIGFCFYYLFPTTAPASIIHSPYFSSAQHATSLKFIQIHQHIQPSTIDGGLIALPSFHVIWAWLCCYLIRGWRIAFGLLLPFNIILALSCVLLGWHYCVDIVASIMVIGVSHYLYYWLGSRSLRSNNTFIGWTVQAEERQ